MSRIIIVNDYVKEVIMQLPLKTRILQYALKKDAAFNLEDVYRDLKDEYKGEALFSKEQLDSYLDALLVVGFLKKTNVELAEDGSLLVTYIISDYGKSREKYLKGYN